MNEEMPWVNLTQEEVIDLRNKKFELTQYGKEKLRKFMNKKPISAKVSTEDYNKVVNALTLTHEEMLEEAERRERSNTVLARYNQFYNDECSGMPHGTPITPEHMQAMALECMVDALICENMNVEYNAIAIDDIRDLIERLYQQSNEFLKRVQDFKDSADVVV
jgi:Mn-dependent DtxR family transcriptional regulator